MADEPQSNTIEEVPTSLQHYLDLQRQQLQLEMQGIRAMMRHAGEKGAEAELAYRAVLRRFLPGRYSIGSGFVSVRDTLSPQLDLIVYDNIHNAPVYEGAGCGVYAVESVYAVIEVTMGQLDGKKLEKDVQKYAKLRDAVKEYGKLLVNFAYGAPRPADDANTYTLDVHRTYRCPLFYIAALSGTPTAPSDLASLFAEVMRRHDVLVDGLLVLSPHDKAEGGLLLWGQPQPGGSLDHSKEPGVLRDGVLYQMLKSMQIALLSMDVGSQPGYPGQEREPKNCSIIARS